MTAAVVDTRAPAPRQGRAWLRRSSGPWEAVRRNGPAGWRRRLEPTVRPGPAIVAPTNKVNVAFPFSSITVEEPSQELAQLAGIVAELARLIEAVAPGSAAEELRSRAQALAARSR